MDREEKGKKRRIIFYSIFIHFDNVINCWHLQCCANPPPKLRYTFTATPNIIMITIRFMHPVRETNEDNTKVGELKKQHKK